MRTKHMKAISRFKAQGLTNPEIAEVVSTLTTLNMPIEKISRELLAKDILNTIRKIKSAAKAAV